MPETKHTPGPWIVEGNGITVRQDRKHASKICQAFEVYMCRQEREANARLIAAAPDMLAALEEAHRLNRMSVFDDGSSADHAARMVQAAIAKARGT
jgi:hypothetical protein